MALSHECGHRVFSMVFLGYRLTFSHIVGVFARNDATNLKFVIDVDDSLTIFDKHGKAGVIGSLLTSIFAA